MSQKRRAEVEVGWRVVRARWMVESDRACVDGRGDGIPSPEVLRRVQREERKRKGVNFVYKSGTARRMLKLLMEQRGGGERVRAIGAECVWRLWIVLSSFPALRLVIPGFPASASGFPA